MAIYMYDAENVEFKIFSTEKTPWNEKQFVKDVDKGEIRYNYYGWSVNFVGNSEWMVAGYLKRFTLNLIKDYDVNTRIEPQRLFVTVLTLEQ